MEKKYFTKVEALEEFTNLWSLGFWPKYVPQHNTHKYNLTPRPKFKNYMDNDTVGDEFNLRDSENHAHSPLNNANTLKPEDFHPPVKTKEEARAELYESIYHGGNRKLVGKDLYDVPHRTKFRL